MTAACRPYSWACMAASTVSASDAATIAISLPSLATCNGSRPSRLHALPTTSGIGRSRSTRVTPTPEAFAISLSVAATPPRVGSRNTWMSAPVAIMACTRPDSGAQSVSTVVPNSRPSRQLMIATPCRPIGPLMITTSPTAARVGRMSTPSWMTPTPAVLMNTPSPCPASTTLVSPVTRRTPATVAACPIAVAMRLMSASAVPSSRMNAVDRYSGRAPDMARSFTVPLTARSPMVPPGKNIGFTTKESVENASRPAGAVSTAESPSSPSAASPNAGRKRCSMSSPDIAPPPPCPITMVGESRSGTGQVQPLKSIGFGVAVITWVSSGMDGHRGELQTPVEVVGGARALGGHHGGAQRVPRRAFPAEGGAFVRLDQALQHLTGAAQGRFDGPDSSDIETVLRVELRVLLRQPPAAAGDHPDAPPRAVGAGEHVGQHRLGRGVAVGTDRTGVGVLDLVLAGFQLPHGQPDALQDVQRLESGHHDRHLVLLRQRRVLRRAHHAADVTGGQKCLYPAGLGLHDGRDRRRHQHVGHQQREVGDPEPLGLVHGHRVRRCGGLEPDAEEDDLPVRVLLRDLQRVQRGVDDADVAAVTLDPEQVLAAAGHPQHVPEGAEDHPRRSGDRQRPIDDLQRGHAHRTARAVDHFDLVGQQLVDAVPDDRVGLPSTDP